MMHTADMLKVFAPYRKDAIVVPGRGGRYWTDLTARPNLDVPLGDPAMGGHAGFALGLALAQPQKKVMLFDSEGDILMSLGMLVTIAEQQPANLYHFLIDNGCYATTGGQPVPNADNIAYDVIARGAGYPRAFAFEELEEFSGKLPEILNVPGPVFVAVKVAPEIENSPIGRRRRWQTRTRDQVIEDLRAELRPQQSRAGAAQQNTNQHFPVPFDTGRAGAGDKRSVDNQGSAAAARCSAHAAE